MGGKTLLALRGRRDFDGPFYRMGCHAQMNGQGATILGMLDGLGRLPCRDARLLFLGCRGRGPTKARTPSVCRLVKEAFCRAVEGDLDRSRLRAKWSMGMT